MMMAPIHAPAVRVLDKSLTFVVERGQIKDPNQAPVKG